MADTSTYCLLGCFYFMFLGSVIMQGFGFYSPHWLTSSTCDKQGLFYPVTRHNTTDGCYHGYYIHTTSELQKYAFFVNLAAGCLMLLVPCSHPNIMFCVFLCSEFLLFPISGILSIAGCIVISQIPIDNFTYGYSFYMCMGSGIYNIIQVPFVCLYMRMECWK